MTIQPVFLLEAVSKRFPFFALDGLSLRLEPGQILGFVGPNGAGKSTTLRLLMGLLTADAGRVEVLGQPMPHGQALAKRDIGCVAQDMGLFGSATLGWHMAFVARFYPGWDATYAKDLLRRFGLQAAQPAKGLSAGERLKALLLLALARRPRLLLLDEPTSGLDPVARHEVLEALMEMLGDERVAIVFSSHNTLDVERIADRIAFLDRGRLVADDDREAFIDRWRRVHLDVAAGVSLPTPDGVTETRRSGGSAVVTTRNWSPEIEAWYRQAGAVVHTVQRLSLEEIFVATVMTHREERR